MSSQQKKGIGKSSVLSCNALMKMRIMWRIVDPLKPPLKVRPEIHSISLTLNSIISFLFLRLLVNPDIGKPHRVAKDHISMGMVGEGESDFKQNVSIGLKIFSCDLLFLIYFKYLSD